MSKASKLRELAQKPATADHQQEFDKQVAPEADDRGACLIITALLENELDRALDHYLSVDNPDLRNELYAQDGPLATFSRKIIMAEAFEIIGPISRANIDIIRHVRNAFAHAKQPIKFSTEEVSAMCLDLKRVNIFDPPEAVDQRVNMESRERFENVCAQISVLLAGYTGLDVQYTLEDGTPKRTQQEPLP